MKKFLFLNVLFLMVVPAVTAQQASGPAETVASFHQALTAGNKDKVLGMLSPELILFEDSGMEASRKEYSSHHLGADMKFSAGAKRKILNQSIRTEADISWVMTRYSVTGKAGGRQIKLESAETMVLERTPEGWRIAHIHWSNKIL